MSKETPKRPPPPHPEPPTTLEGGATPQEQFESNYQEAYLLIDRGITFVTEGHNAQAGVLLQKGLSLIDKALAIKVESFDCSAEKTQQYAEMQAKMRYTRKEVLEHFSDTQASSGGTSSRQGEDAPPSYDDYLKSLESGASGSNMSASASAATAGTSENPSYPDLSSDFGMMDSSPLVTPVVAAQQGEMIFNVENGVQIFFILPDGTVTSPSYPSFLAIFTFPEPIKGAPGAGANARGFLQVGEWSYPLVPAQSPVLHSFYGAYMFPNFSSSVAGSSVGVILPDSVDKDNRDLFEQILTQLTSYQEQAAPPGEEGARQVRLIQESTSERIAAGAEAVSKGVVWGAGKLSELISYGSESLKDYVQPVAEKKEVDPKWHKTAEVARDISGKAVKVSGYLLSQVGKATMTLGRKLAPHLQRQGTRAITHITGQKESEANSNVEGVLEVAAGAVKGASTIYMGLESAAATLATSLTDNTVKVVTHKYGENVGALTDNTLYAVGQTAWAGHNIASLGVKGVAKRVAKDTGKALVLNHEEKKASTQEVEEAEEAMEDGEKNDTEEHPVRPVREKKKPPL
ncbi:spartin-like isoform X2 [Portunus trituberculatus]|uniref:spartin-like isoform X2 n=1 Tax=Portunus trituberculatus TaxID=210409 RepID=UPI001E1CF93A|nr:spartin-like isoform X2 [Portunus trituberculatus]